MNTAFVEEAYTNSTSTNRLLAMVADEGCDSTVLYWIARRGQVAAEVLEALYKRTSGEEVQNILIRIRCLDNLNASGRLLNLGLADPDPLVRKQVGVRHPEMKTALIDAEVARAMREYLSAESLSQ